MAKEEHRLKRGDCTGRKEGKADMVEKVVMLTGEDGEGENCGGGGGRKKGRQRGMAMLYYEGSCDCAAPS
jgi:hypothetical protein